LDDRAKGEPVVAGTEAYRYMKTLIRMGSSRKNVSLYDVDGTLHWVHPSQIIYLEASRKRTIVHCMTKNIVVPAVIRDAIEMVDGKIMRVHRSYAVNRDHVIELKGGHLLLDDGTSIAIPAKRLADVRAALTVH
jgi:DNA-binding LytR/AlgR family response regulator